MSEHRLSIWQAAYVIARRDFVAILFSRAFLFFLLGPLFPILVGGLAGGIGSSVAEQSVSREIGVAMGAADTAAMVRAGQRLQTDLGPVMPALVAVPGAATPGFDARATLERERANYAAIVTGTRAAPRIVGPEHQVAQWSGRVALIAASASGGTLNLPPVAAEIVASSSASERVDRLRTAQAGQLLLFLLIMLLAGMVLSNLVEEKGNKIIEVLAAAIPMDAVFLGKLFAMLAVSFVGIVVWGAAAGVVFGLGGFSAGALTEPALGWPLFLGLGVIYFAMGYLLLGALFLTIGSMAKTVREVQTLSMPATMMQLLVFFLASYTLANPGSGLELAGAVFPFSSPFTMMARAAQDPAIWPHLVAIAWQALCVAVFVKAGATLFRRKVMQSGPAPARRRWFARG